MNNKISKYPLKTSNNDEVYIKSYIRKINGTNIGPLQPSYTKLYPISPVKRNRKYMTSLDSTERFLIPNIECKNVSESFCKSIENIVLEIENDLRKNIVIYNPIVFTIIFHDINDNSGNCQKTFESDTHLASTYITAYYLLNSENSHKKSNYPQSLAKQFITNYQLKLQSSDFIITLSQNEEYYITNAEEINRKPNGYDLKLILYHEIIHGLGIKSEAFSYQYFLETYSVNPGDYTYYTDEDSYLLLMTEPSIYDTFIRNDNISPETLAEEMQPMVSQLPLLKNKLSEYKELKIINFSYLMTEVVEKNETVLNGAWRALNIVTQDGLYFKGKRYKIPLQVFVNEFHLGVSISHTKHYENEFETGVGDDILLDWKIPVGKLISNTQTNSVVNPIPNNSIMGPKIFDMLNTIGWPSLNDTVQPKYIVNDSVNIFAMMSETSNSNLSMSFIHSIVFELCIFLIIILRY